MLRRYWIDPYRREVVTRYTVEAPKLPVGRAVRIAVIADLHASTGFMPLHRVNRVVAVTQGLDADLVLLLGDYLAEHGRFQTPIPLDQTVSALGKLSAPLGVHAVLGNHDWWDDPAAQDGQTPLPNVATLLNGAGVTVLHNGALKLPVPDAEIWLAGLGCQTAFWAPKRKHRSSHDIAKTLAKVPHDALHILMAHEPDIFPQLPDRVCLTLSGHTHGGQVKIFGTRPVVPSKYGARYAYGQVQEGRKTLITSGGLGCSKAPLRFGMVPEVLLVTLVGTAAPHPSIS